MAGGPLAVVLTPQAAQLASWVGEAGGSVEASGPGVRPRAFLPAKAEGTRLPPGPRARSPLGTLQLPHDLVGPLPCPCFVVGRNVVTRCILSKFVEGLFSVLKEKRRRQM